ncbi:MAG: helix-turn-helix domain-containing protein [bacterium]|nr:helix-turn-helix domain-containing protein [bacterium]
MDTHSLLSLPNAAEPLRPAVLTLDEAAALIGTSRRVVRKAIADGQIDAIKVGRTVYVLRGPFESKLKLTAPGGAA